jgi:uncharacterized protein YqeY
VNVPGPAADPGGDVLIRLRSALGEALRARDMVAVGALRSALSAIGNAEAVAPGSPVAAGAGGEYFAGAVAGLGAAEARRRTLSAAEIERIVRAEAGERLRAAAEYERAGHADRAARLHSEAWVLTSLVTSEVTTVVDSEDQPGRQPGSGLAGPGRMDGPDADTG